MGAGGCGRIDDQRDKKRQKTKNHGIWKYDEERGEREGEKRGERKMWTWAWEV